VAIGFVSESLFIGIFAMISHPPPWLIHVLSALVGAGDAMSSSGLYVYAATFNVQCTASVAFGSAIAGWFVSIIRWFTILVFSQNQNIFYAHWHSAQLFFISVSIILLGCLISLSVTMKFYAKNTDINELESFETEILSHVNVTKNLFLQKHPSEGSSASYGSHESSLIEIPTICLENEEALDHSEQSVDKINNCNAAKANLPQFLNECHPSSSIPCRIYHQMSHHIRTALQSTNFKLQKYLPQPILLYVETLYIVWQPALVGFINFFITLSLFPGVVTLISSSTSLDGVKESDNFQLLLIFLFNVWDCLGRFILTFSCTSQSLVPPDYSKGRNIHESFTVLVTLPAFLRFCFFPLIIACVDSSEKPKNGGSSVLSTGTFDSGMNSLDLLKCCLISIFGFSNGYVFGACFMVGPAMVEEYYNCITNENSPNNKPTTKSTHCDGESFCEESQSGKEFDHRAHKKDAASLCLLLCSYIGLALGGVVGICIVKRVIP